MFNSHCTQPLKGKLGSQGQPVTEVVKEEVKDLTVSLPCVKTSTMERRKSQINMIINLGKTPYKI